MKNSPKNIIAVVTISNFILIDYTSIKCTEQTSQEMLRIYEQLHTSFSILPCFIHTSFLHQEI